MALRFSNRTTAAFVFMSRYTCERKRVCVADTFAYTAELEISGRRLRKRLTDVLGTVFSKAVGGL